jgi:hypothetical protein
VIKLIERGKFKFSTEVEYFDYVMDHYFRKIPPVPTNVYLNSSTALKLENRIKLASLCHFPSIINTLARDENYEVQEAARKNDFWILVGQLQDVLGFDKRERKEFARQEVFPIILVLLMFEDDLDVLREALRNASISTRMLTFFIQLLDKRGRGKKDQQIVQEAQDVLAQKKDRIVKAAEIRKYHKNLGETENQKSLVAKLSDDDPVIRKAVTNILFDLKPRELFNFIHLASESTIREKILNQFLILTELQTLVKKKEDIKHLAINELDIDITKYPEIKDSSVAEFFSKVINDKRLELIDRCQEDLTDFQNVLLLANCHCDSDEQIRKIAINILSLEDIFSLLNDISTPQHLFKSILDILTDHEDEDIRKKVNATYHQESRRLWNRLKELEQSINAYFDIIFQSLGFTQINELNVSMKTIEQAERTIINLAPRFESTLNNKIHNTVSTFTEIKKAIEMQIYDINSDITNNKIKDLYHIIDMIQQVFELKDMGKEGLRPGVFSDIDPDLLVRAHTIWQSTLGQYLGRIKHLNEMVKIKFSIMAKDFEKHENLQNDFLEVMETFEKMNKKNVECTLEIACNQCSKRNCAAERFLYETEFFIDELIDNFVQE